MTAGTLAILALGAAALLLGSQWRAERARHAATEQRLARLVPRHARAAEEGGREPALARLLLRARLGGRAAAAAGLAMGISAAAAWGVVGGTLGAAAAAGVLAAGVAALRWRVSRELGLLHDALPAFLDRFRQHLLIGASVPQALARATASGAEVIRWAFEPAERRLQAGGELVDTLAWLARRHGSDGLAGIATCVAAASRFGGRLSDALGNLAEMERRRLAVQQEMRAATAEVRASSVLLALLPLAVGAWLLLAVPGYGDYFADPERGQPVLLGVAALYGTGLLLLRRIARVRF